MDIIAESMYEAVESVFAEMEQAGVDTAPKTPDAKMKGQCMYYAAAGMYVTDDVLGRDYHVEVGSLGVHVGNGMMAKIDATNGGVAARRFHMWLESDDAGFKEYVDFTSRFFKGWAVSSGCNWARGELPNYLCGRQKDIREQHGVYYEMAVGEEVEANKQIDANDAIIQKIRHRARQEAPGHLAQSASANVVNRQLPVTRCRAEVDTDGAGHEATTMSANMRASLRNRCSAICTYFGFNSIPMQCRP